MGTKITALPQVVNTVGTDELPISQDDGSGGRITYKATLDQVKNYVKNSGGGSGSVTSVGVNSTDGSISVFGSPIVGAGTITVNVSSVGLAKLDDGGAIGGQVLTYNGSTSTWVASAVPKELPQTALSGQVLTYNGSTSTWVASAVPKELPQTALSGQVLTYNGSTSTWVASAGIGQSSVLKFGTAVTLTNQTSVDFTGIPSWARRITLCLSGFSTNGTSLPKVQLGSGSIQATGYKGAVWSGAVIATHHSTGFYLINSSTADSYVGHTIVTFIEMMDNLWMVSMTGGYESVYICIGGGSVTLSGALDRLRLTTENGTDQFDAGIVNIMWE